MANSIKIAGYCRISVDDELTKDNVSIENQKDIITSFVNERFPGAGLTFFVDRDRSGYTFEQRENYQAMRRRLIDHTFDILVVKDFSRFSRRNSKGLVELEDLRDAGVRIISIGDNVDFPNDDDWLKIQFQFLINEMPVTDASKKVKAVIRAKQEKGEFVHTVPYGYLVTRGGRVEIVPEEAEIVRKIYDLYISGYGYSRIEKWLNEHNILTPTQSQKERYISEGIAYRRRTSAKWCTKFLSNIIGNDFYIGTLRQKKFERVKIHGDKKPIPKDKQFVFENHHPSIIDKNVFNLAVSIKENRSAEDSHYRGFNSRKNRNPYVGIIKCGDCGASMVMVATENGKIVYKCKSYYRWGLKYCTSHRIEKERLNDILRQYIANVKDCSEELRKKFGESINAVVLKRSGKSALKVLGDSLSSLNEELAVTRRQKIKEICRHPDAEETIEKEYESLEDEIKKKIQSLNEQIKLAENASQAADDFKRNITSVKELFEMIESKEEFDPVDVQLIAKKIIVFTDHTEVELTSDISEIIQLTNQIAIDDDIIVKDEGADENRPAEEAESECINVVNDTSPVVTTLIRAVKSLNDILTSILSRKQ